MMTLIATNPIPLHAVIQSGGASKSNGTKSQDKKKRGETMGKPQNPMVYPQFSQEIYIIIDISNYRYIYIDIFGRNSIDIFGQNFGFTNVTTCSLQSRHRLAHGHMVMPRI